MNVSIHIDGGSRGNPGPAAVGIVIADQGSGQTLHEAGYYLGTATNNVAEYKGMIKALELAASHGASGVMVHSDSELMVKQLLGQYRVKSRDLKPLFEQVQMALLGFDHWQVRHVYREKNRRADELVNKALDARRDVVVRAWDGSAEAGTEPAPAPGQPRLVLPEEEEPTPAWSVALQTQPGPECPAPVTPGRVFDFGPETPSGLCIFAAQAVFDDEPTGADDRTARMHDVTCRRCRAVIRVRPEE